MGTNAVPPRQDDTPSLPPEAWEPLLRLRRLATRPLERFLRIQASSGLLLLMAAAIALILANSPWAGSYDAFWHTQLGIRIGGFTFERNLEWLVNDVLMVVFFFVIGLEVRRELHHGELADWRRAALPLAAALGGMVVPAVIYLAVASPDVRDGWAVPMATDIAFAVGILALLGRRVPAALRVLLLAVAVIDDLGAIVVIALFYSSGITFSGLMVAALGFAGIFVMQRFGIRSKVAYILPAAVAWAGVYGAGIHPTIAGVIVGLATPVKVWLGPAGFLAGVRTELAQLAQRLPEGLSSGDLARRLGRVNRARREAMSPADSLVETLHPWVAYGIMPLFALANAGVTFATITIDPITWRLILGIIAGLVLGKLIGVLLAAWAAVRLGVSVLPGGVDRRHIALLGLVAGIGFTMALFISQLAFTDPNHLAAARLAVLTASGMAGVAALVLGNLLLKPGDVREAQASVDEAEGRGHR